MYSILINKKDYQAKTLELTVFVFTYDFKAKTHLPLPQYDSFFLDFLINANNKRYTNAKLILEDYKCDDSFLAAHTNKFIEKVELLHTNNHPLPKWQQKYHNKKDNFDKDYSQLVQGTYIIHLVDELYMDYYYEGFHYKGIFRDIAPIDASILNKYNLPNVQQYVKEISDVATDYIKTAEQIKISNNNDYIFFTFNDNQLCIVHTANWTLKSEFIIEDAYYKLRQDNKNNILWLQDYDEIIEAFDLNSEAKIKYINPVCYYMSASMNLMCNWEENEPINIKDNQGNILFSIPDKAALFYYLAFCPNDKFLAVGYDKSIDIWDIEKQILVQSISFEKGVLHKLIFSHDSHVIYALAENIVYGISIENSLTIFQHKAYDSDNTIKDFDISDKYFAILEVPKVDRNYIYRSCFIYEINTNKFAINSITLNQIRIKSEEKREQFEVWAKVLKSIPLTEEDAQYIERLSYNIDKDYLWCNLSHNLRKIAPYLALEAGKIAYEISPNDRQILFNLGTFYSKIQDYENAIFYLRKCLKDYPEYTGTYYNLSSALSSIGEYEEAISLMHQLLKKSPNSLSAYTSLTIFYIKSKQLEKAREAALKGISKGNKAECSMNLAHTYYLENDIETARQYYETSLQNFDDKEQFFKDMIIDYKDTISLYNIPKETWYAFVEEFRPIPV